MIRTGIWMMAALAGLWLTGCAQLAVQQITEPPTHEPLAYQTDLEAFAGITTATWQSPDGVQLAWRDVPAAKRGMTYVFQHKKDSADFDMDLEGKPEPLPEVGTVVYLHGWGLDGSTMVPWAMALSQRGWHGVSVDLRHHGRSSPAPVGYGPREAADVAGLLMALRAEGRIKPPVFLFGVSYGATAALFAEQALAGQVSGIIALAPYANAADAVRAGVHMAAKDGGPSGWLAQRYSGEQTQQLIDAANQRLGLDLRTIDLHAAVRASRTCTLILHGADDKLLPAATSRALAAGNTSVRYIDVPGHGHVTTPLRVDWLGPALADWMAAVAATGGCPADWQLPADQAERGANEPQASLP